MKETETQSGGKNRRHFQYGAAASALVILVAAVIVLVNVLSTSLTKKYNLKLDLTPNSLFRISGESEEFIRNLDKDVRIIILADEETFLSGGDYYIQANEVIRSYARLNPRITLEYSDLAANPVLRRRFPDAQLSSKAVIVSCGDEYRTLSPYELFNTQSDYYGNTYISSSQAEQAMTSAILAITNDQVFKVSVVSGHGEPVDYLYGLTGILELNNYEIQNLNLLTEEIDPDSRLVVLFAPMRDLEEQELEKLDAFLDGGQGENKSLFYCPYPSIEGLPRLDAFLEEWGVRVESGIVFETNYSLTYNFDNLTFIANYNENIYSQQVQERNQYVVMPSSRPLSIASGKRSDVQVSTLLTASDTAVVFPFDADASWTPEGAPSAAGAPLLTVSKAIRSAGGEAHQASVVVSGSFAVMLAEILEIGAFGNADYFLGVIDDAAGRERVVSLSPKTFGGNLLGINTMQVIVIGIVLALILPLAIVIFGLVVWTRRNRM